MAISDHVHVARRFQRSVRIDTDLGDISSLEGFICPKSSSDVLLTMTKHINETGQGAFTWTGPYGSGKSSLIIALSALLNGNDKLRADATLSVGKDVAEQIWADMPPKSKGWQIIPVVGRRDAPSQVIGEALSNAKITSPGKDGLWTESDVLTALKKTAAKTPKTRGGLIVFIDEMGKFLEGAAQDGADIYLFQQMAEIASRSSGRLIIVGILHQAFEEYASRLSRELRDEWSKIQGRFIDLAVNTAGEEQIDILSRAIVSKPQRKRKDDLAAQTTKLITANRPGTSPHLEAILSDCWPLHPVVAALLGPISRRRFGQNQRSLFGFLNSAEPSGFQDFLRHAEDGDLFDPVRLWDYLQINLEPAILASPDGHRWALSVEGIERCSAVGGDELHTRLLKTIALIDLFKGRSGLTASRELLTACAPDYSQNEIKKTLKELEKWSFIIFKKFLGGYAIFAGSDFDIEEAVKNAADDIHEINFGTLKEIADLHPILAKRHYHGTGALRWFDVDIAPLKDIAEIAGRFEPHKGSIGQFLLAIPTENETTEIAQSLCKEAAGKTNSWDIIVGLSRRSWTITGLARDLIALGRVQDNSPELQGDEVARREIQARLSDFRSQLEAELHLCFDGAEWFQSGKRKPARLIQGELNGLASQLADKRYPETPRLHSELLNRIKPSSNAVAAQNMLLRKMTLNEGNERLGIEGYPAEGGLFASMLEASGLYTHDRKTWRFVTPKQSGQDPCNLQPLWDAASSYLEKLQSRTVAFSEIFNIWRAPPFGVKDGLLPTLGVAYLLSKRDTLAFYRQGIFQARFTDLDVDYLVKDPADIQLRWMDLSKTSRKLLSEMAGVVRELDENNSLTDLTPIDVARGLITIYENLQPWTKRTMRLSQNAIQVRDIFKKAKDPNRFLFDDLPSTIGGKTHKGGTERNTKTIASIRSGLKEQTDAYPTMLNRFGDLILSELQVPNSSPEALDDLHARAKNIKALAGDFRLESFITRLMVYDGSQMALENIAGLAANKPSNQWTDADLDSATIEAVDLAQRFNKAEAFARVKGRKDKRHAMAVIVGINGRPTPLLEEFDITDKDKKTISALVDGFDASLQKTGNVPRNVILAALAELSAQYMGEQND